MAQKQNKKSLINGDACRFLLLLYWFERGRIQRAYIVKNIELKDGNGVARV